MNGRTMLARFAKPDADDGRRAVMAFTNAGAKYFKGSACEIYNIMLIDGELLVTYDGVSSIPIDVATKMSPEDLMESTFLNTTVEIEHINSMPRGQ